MFGLNRIKSFFTENESEHELSIREILSGKVETSDYHLKNISPTEVSDGQVVSHVPSPVHENIAYAEERLSELINENEKKALETLKIVEALDCTSKSSWTDVVNDDITIDK
ncbi:MAG: hypothetical protein P8J14_13270 [Emcibacteraceae bacterium]|nr:hypothetical protein [Emcibacteraceae bacterium]